MLPGQEVNYKGQDQLDTMRLVARDSTMYGQSANAILTNGGMYGSAFTR